MAAVPSRASGRVRQGLTLERARDLMWMLTSRDVYRMLVLEKQWTPAAYQQWLAETLVSEPASRSP